MTKAGYVIIAFIAGSLMGVFFFAGLWWTIMRGRRAPRPQVFFWRSLSIRTGAVLLALYYTTSMELGGVVAYLSGLVLVRTILLRYLPMRQSMAEGE